VTNVTIAGKASAKLFFLVTPSLPLFILGEISPFSYASISLGAEVLYLSSVTYLKG